MKKLLVGFACAAICFLVVGTADAAVPTLYKNCTNLHTRYPHGVGKAYARDRTRSGTNPVTTFKRSTRLYRIAISWNRDLDRDRDGIACEKH